MLSLKLFANKAFISTLHLHFTYKTHICYPKRQFIRCLNSTRIMTSALQHESFNLSKTERFTESVKCPSCQQICFRPLVFHRHINRCCPDLLQGSSKDDLNTMERVKTWLERAEIREEELRAQCIEIAFRQTDHNGNPIRQGPPEIASIVGCDIERAERLFKTALKAVPIQPNNLPIEIIYEDEDIIGLNKATGIISSPKHRYTGESLVHRLVGRGIDPNVIHRLDMNTTGVIIFAKTKYVVRGLHEQFREKTARKTYLALVMGVPQWEGYPKHIDENGKEYVLVEAPIGRNPADPVARMVRDDGKPAATKFRIVAYSPDADLSSSILGQLAPPSLANIQKGAALVACEPLTGRTHQIRVHLAHAGHPIIGDEMYGVSGPWLERQALHAAELKVKHPRSGEQLHVVAPLPKDMRAALDMLRVEYQEERLVVGSE